MLVRNTPYMFFLLVFSCFVALRAHVTIHNREITLKKKCRHYKREIQNGHIVRNK